MRLFGTMKNENGILNIGGVDCRDLLIKHGSPLYVMDRQHIEDMMNIMKKSFSGKKVETEIIYASKAFLNKAMCQLVAKEGLSLDVVSGGELFTAIQAGFPMEKVYMHGNNKTAQEIKMALDHGVGTIVVDNIDELALIEKMCDATKKTANALLRVNPGIDAHTHEYIQTTKHSSKFGVSIYNEQYIKEVISRFEMSEYVTLQGFHCHIGSQIFDEKPFFAEGEAMLEFAKKMETEIGFVTKQLNLGGGFGIYYAEGDDPINPDVFLEKVIENFEDKMEEFGLNIEKVMIEPGRSLVANAGTTLYTVGGMKETFSGKKYIFVDGGMTDNIRPALYQAEYEGIIANKMNAELTETATVAGKCCESGDVLIRDGLFTKPQTGDVLAIASTGAYNYTMSSNYNRLSRPAVVMVKDGKSNVIVKRETYEDLMRNDLDLD